MDRRIRVSSELRARDVPPGTKVTPRGREYMMLGLLGGWIIGGICMYLTWDTEHPVISGLKVFGAATVGSLLGTIVSWFTPSTRQRIKVIKELKVQLEEERKIEAEGPPEIPGRTVGRVTAPPPRPAPRTFPERRVVEAAASEPQARRGSVANDAYEEPVPVIYTAPGEPAPPIRGEIERVERPRGEGDHKSLLEALEQYGSDAKDDPRK